MIVRLLITFAIFIFSFASHADNFTWEQAAKNMNTVKGKLNLNGTEVNYRYGINQVSASTNACLLEATWKDAANRTHTQEILKITTSGYPKKPRSIDQFLIWEIPIADNPSIHIKRSMIRNCWKLNPAQNAFIQQKNCEFIAAGSQEKTYKASSPQQYRRLKVRGK